ncbi:MAG: hypothetical protein KC438_10280 [Thermomicrobiales bacterium]|nr:hypothetical protein [Thermomicrobiales bacterium]MCO5220209.1 hypothetical protein [Thermomicrobiales bacterium]
MEAVLIVVVITLAFAVANLFVPMAATKLIDRDREPISPNPTLSLEHPFYARTDGMPRTRIDRHDLQLAIGPPDVEQSVWPRA